ncbi:NADH-quinone oxidoreductase subunit J [Nigerium massiliense]|uniref:NADH-quinone oxidoreductase subunit J n=1 Tax=Nigerium massiliense TaxID=1522317 RepID=UPI0006932D60|nr:NADH-quinone oxidoreductase subunit J [Nigerium massiliense]
MNPALIPLVTGTEVTFWVCATMMVLGALGLVLFRKAVYCALSMVVVMVNLAVLYAAMEGPFLFVTQIIVYTGAIMMLFVFVMMLVGIDRPDSTVETIKGQRVLGLIAGVLLAALLIYAIAGAVTVGPAGLAGPNAADGGNVQGLAGLLFGRYIFVFELTAALLITAAVGAMVLAHHQRIHPKAKQRDLADERMRAYAATGEHPGTLPNSGIFATHNSIGAPALLPDGSVAEKSVSKTLVARGATIDPAGLQEGTRRNFEELERVRDADEEDDE